MNTLSFVPSIDIIIGPMYSGKTTELIRRLELYHELGKKVLYINHNIDNRSKTSFSTHSNTITQVPYDNIKVDELDKVKLDYDIIGIDEGQFFPNLFKTVKSWVEDEKKTVIISGLNGDYKRKEMGELLQLIPLCDSITKLSSFCKYCKDRNSLRLGIFTKRITVEKDLIKIGGKDSYAPVCRECFLK